MKKHFAVAIAVTLLTAAVVTAQPKKPAPQSAAPQAPGFQPGFDDLMTMLVQPRHIKLHYAGAAKNWELAAHQARSLRASLDRIGQAIPSYIGNNVNAANATFIIPQMDAIDAAIAAADAEKFATAYKDLTDGCNECHTYMERPFLVSKIPTGPNPYPDQDFEPAP